MVAQVRGYKAFGFLNCFPSNSVSNVDVVQPRAVGYTCWLLVEEHAIILALIKAIEIIINVLAVSFIVEYLHTAFQLDTTLMLF